MRKWYGWLVMALLLAACGIGGTEVPATPTVDPTNDPAVSGPAGSGPAVTSTPGSAELDTTPAGSSSPPVIKFERGGGLDGSFQAWEVYADGTLRLADSPDGAAVEAGQVTAEQVSGLVSGLDALGF